MRNHKPVWAKSVWAALLALGCAHQRHVASMSPAVDVAAYARILRMADSRRLDTALVHGALRSPERQLRAAATLAIGQTGGREMLPELRLLLADADTAVAANAAFALGLLHDSAAAEPLTAALGAAAPVAAEAAWALGQIGAREPISRALAAQRSAQPHAPVAGALLLAASKLRPMPASAVAPYLRSADPEIRWRAAYAFSRPAAPGAGRWLLPLASDSNGEVRAQVARALTRQLADDSARADALVALRSLSADPDPHVRINAVRSLATYGHDVRDAMLAATHDRDANVRIAVAQSLGGVLDSSATSWAAAWEADTGLTYRRSLLTSAARAGASLPAMNSTSADAWQRSRDWRLRAAVAEAAGAARTFTAVAGRALPLSRDPDGRVRAAALEALVPFADSTQHPEIRAALLDALRDTDFTARAAALGALSRRASVAELPRVLEGYRRALADSSNDARLATVRYVASAWHRDSASFSESLRQQLRGLATPSEVMVAAEGKSVPLLASWRGVEQSVQPVAWYEERVRQWVIPALEGHSARAYIDTDRGLVTVELFGYDAPLTVHNFASLASGRYYDHVRFHRVVPNFVAQDGDPRGDGNGGPPYTIRDELNRRRYDRGAVGMALSGPDTGGSQYFLTLSPQPHLDGGYTVFGRVVAGFDVLDRIVQGDRIVTIRVR